jgi:uncharacterized protein YoxC
MSPSDVVGLVAVIIFAVLVGLLAVPILKLGKTLDAVRESARQLTDQSVPLLVQSSQMVASANTVVERADTISQTAAEATQQLSALTGRLVQTVGTPLIKVAALSYAVRQTFSRRRQAKAK